MNEEETTIEYKENVSIDNPEIVIDNKEKPEEEIDKLDRKAWDNLVEEMSNRFTFATPALMESIKSAANMGCPDREIALHAGISKQTLYTWIKAYPLLGELIDLWKEEPVLKARKTIIAGLEKDENAKWYLERKTKGEFANQQKNYNADVTTDTLTEDEKNNLKELLGI